MASVSLPRKQTLGHSFCATASSGCRPERQARGPVGAHFRAGHGFASEWPVRGCRKPPGGPHEAAATRNSPRRDREAGTRSPPAPSVPCLMGDSRPHGALSPVSGRRSPDPAGQRWGSQSLPVPGSRRAGAGSLCRHPGRGVEAPNSWGGCPWQ